MIHSVKLQEIKKDGSKDNNELLGQLGEAASAKMQ